MSEVQRGRELLVALWTLENLPPLQKLPNFHCWYCEEEIEERPVFFKRLWACHGGQCIKRARAEFGKCMMSR